MVTAIITPTNGEYLTTFAVKFKRGRVADFEFFAVSFKPTQKLAENWACQQLRKFMQKEIIAFCAQRKTAFLKVNLDCQGFFDMLDKVKEVSKKTSLHDTCTFIINHQNYLRQLVPHPSSAQYYWHYAIEEIITEAFNFLTTTKGVATKYDSIHQPQTARH